MNIANQFPQVAKFLLIKEKRGLLTVEIDYLDKGGRVSRKDKNGEIRNRTLSQRIEKRNVRLTI